MIGFGANLAFNPAVKVQQSGACIDFDFSTASVNPKVGGTSLSVSRSGSATRVNSAGSIESVPANTARLNHDPTTLQYENLFVYSEQFGNAAWQKFNSSFPGNLRIGPDGKSTALLWVEASGSSQKYLRTSLVNISVAGVYTMSSHVCVASGTRYFVMEFDQPTQPDLRAIFDVSTGVVTFTNSGSITATIVNIGNGWYRCIVTASVEAGTGPYFCITNNSASIAPYNGDGTSGLYLFGAQLNSGSSVLAYRKTEATALAKWYACKGMLIEESRTNSIRNNTMQGASAGSPGTPPTNWFVGTVSGVTSSIVGTGTESGISYVDIRWSGTASASGSLTAFFETVTGIAATTGQTWSMSIYSKLAAGSMSGINAYNFLLNEHTSGGSYITGGASAQTAPTSADLILQRKTLAKTLSGGATTAFILPFVELTVTNGAVIDITLRIGMPQIEQGAFTTSVIPTTSAAVTRNGDQPLFYLPSALNQSEGTLFAQFDTAIVSTAGRVVSIDDGAVSSNSFDITVTGAAKVAIEGVASGSYVGSVTASPTIAANTTVKVAARYSASTTDAISVNGSAITTGSISLPISGLTTARLGWQSNGTYLNGHIAKFRIYALDTDLSAITA